MKVLTVGHATPSLASLTASLAIDGMSDTARKALRNDLTNRRSLLTGIIERNKDNKTFTALKNLSNKEMKKMSKGFMLVYRYVEPLGFHIYEKGGKVPSVTETKKIALTINSLCSSTQFAGLDIEDVNTDHFRLVLATYMSLKKILTDVQAKRKTDVTTSALIDATSELGLRLYSLYVDNRQDHASNEETVVFR